MNLIFSVDENWAIGKQNQLLFQVPADMQMFRERTLGGAVIMGRKTWETLPNGKPLTDRLNIVLSRNPDPRNFSDSIVLEAPDKHVSHDKEDAKPGFDDPDPVNKKTMLVFCHDLDALVTALIHSELPPQKVWVIGGAEIYKMLMPYCDTAYVTRFLTVDPEADCWMENLTQLSAWVLEERGNRQEWDGFGFYFERYKNLAVIPLPAFL